ncbi:unnamed protein product [Gadus morhua 'NCC']
MTRTPVGAGNRLYRGLCSDSTRVLTTCDPLGSDFTGFWTTCYPLGSVLNVQASVFRGLQVSEEPWLGLRYQAGVCIGSGGVEWRT